MFGLVRKLLFGSVLVLPVLFVGAEVAAKHYAERSLAENAQAHDPAATSTSATVSAPVLFGLLTRQTVDKISISADHVAVENFLLDRTTAVLHGVHFDLKESIRQSEPQIRSIDRLDATTELSQEQASKLLPAGLRFVFSPGQAEIVGGPFSITGSLEAAGTGIVFKPSVPLPKQIRIPVISLGNTLGECLNNMTIVTETGHVTISCSENDPPANFGPFPGEKILRG